MLAGRPPPGARGRPSASTSRYAGSAFGMRVRSNRAPASSAMPRASMSRSYRISRWSATNPAEQTTTRVPAARRQLLDHRFDRRSPPRVVRPARALPRDQVVVAGRAARRPGRPSPAARRGTGTSRRNRTTCSAACRRRASAPAASAPRRSRVAFAALARRSDDRAPRRRAPRGSAMNAGWSWYERTNVNAGPPPSSSRRLDHAFDVRLDRHPGPVRRHHDADRALRRRRRASLAIASRDERLRVLHPEVGAERVRRRPRRRSAARPGPRPVPGSCPASGNTLPIAAYRSSQLREMLGRRRAATADVRVVPLDVVGTARGPVGHHQHADGRVAQPGASRRSVRSWTRSTSRRSVSGSVVGGTPCPRLKMCPSRTARAGAARDRSRPPPRPTAPSSTAGSRFPWTADVGPGALPRHVERGAPVHADHVAAGPAHQREQLAGPDTEVDRSGRPGRRGRRTAGACAEGRDRSYASGRERTDPRVEDLQRLRARLDLRPEVRHDDRDERLHQRVPHRGFAEHQGLRALVRPRWAALDQVARQRERRAGEPDQRHLELLTQQPDRLEHVRDVRLRLERPQPRDVGERADRVVHHRTHARARSGPGRPRPRAAP